MTQYRIAPSAGALEIEIVGVGDQRDALLAAFGECAKGNCSCPTNEYEKVAAMDVRTSPDAIHILLGAKPGTEFDTREIEACLDYTVRRPGK